jgi:hypothetical protein
MSETWRRFGKAGNGGKRPAAIAFAKAGNG